LDCIRHAFGFAVDVPPTSLAMLKQSDAYLSEEAFERRIRDLSCGLVEVKSDPVEKMGSEKQNQIIQFIHETVRTFFVENKYAWVDEFHTNAGHSQSGKAYGIVMQACLNYLATSDAMNAITWPSDIVSYSQVPFLKYAARWLHEHMGSDRTRSSDQYQEELSRRLGGPSNSVFRVWKEVHCSLVKIPRKMHFHSIPEAGFLEYAAIQGLSYSVSAELKASSGSGPQAPGGVTPLMKLLSIDSRDGARLLVAQGMDVRCRDDYGRTVLFYARSLEMIEMLLEAGAEANGIWTSPQANPLETYGREASGIGVTALIYHIRDFGIVECLLRHGADVGERSLRGKPALYYASSEASARLVSRHGVGGSISAPIELL
jgi:hypothetical protein